MFCLEIHFPLYFLHIFFRNVSFHGFLFKKSYVIVWEKVCCGLSAATPVVVLQIFLHCNNHSLFYWKPFCFSQKNSWTFASSIFPKPESIGSVNLSQALGLYDSGNEKALYCLRAPSCESSNFVIWCYHLFSWPLLGQPLTCGGRARTHRLWREEAISKRTSRSLFSPTLGNSALCCWWKLKCEASFYALDGKKKCS